MLESSEVSQEKRRMALEEFPPFLEVGHTRRKERCQEIEPMISAILGCKNNIVRGVFFIYLPLFG